MVEDEIRKSVIVPAFQDAQKKMQKLINDTEEEVSTMGEDFHFPAYLSVTKKDGARKFKYILKKRSSDNKDPTAKVEVERRYFDRREGRAKDYKILTPTSSISGKPFSDLSQEEITADIIKLYKDRCLN